MRAGSRRLRQNLPNDYQMRWKLVQTGSIGAKGKLLIKIKRRSNTSLRKQTWAAAKASTVSKTFLVPLRSFRFWFQPENAREGEFVTPVLIVPRLWPVRGSILALMLSSAVHLLVEALILGWVALRIRAHRGRSYC